ncbi:glycerol 3-phosphatase-2 [Marmoricola sp. OAE513]|uniref:HAD-IIA family hydrolase n=1 Tax=Marmoricola sp. OAE513 TaxID=2817894 RepID=UPI001AE18194
MTGSRPLSDRYDVAVLDLDGVVYIGAHAVENAPGGLAAAREAGMKLAFVTNNAARPPADVARHLTRIGIPAEPADVVTSAQAAARLVAEQVPAGAPVYVIGGPGLEAALREHSLVPLTTVGPEHPEPVAVVQGYGPDMPWRQVITGALLVREGLPWVASNTDLTVPTPRGAGPGNGTLVRLVAEYADRSPVVAGKPQPPLFRETLARVGGKAPLVVGDRIDTDIEGAIAVGWDSLLVMTGVTTLADVAALEPALRPTYVAADLTALTREVEAGTWSAEVVDDRLRVHGTGDEHSWWAAVSLALWAHLDATGRPARTTSVVPGSVAP